MVEHWMGILDEIGELGETAPPETDADGDQPRPPAGEMPHKKRRRRRRRGRRGGHSSGS
jgi:hypothetical protein